MAFPIIVVFGVITLVLYWFGIVIFSAFLFLFLVFLWPTFWILGTTLFSIASAFGPATLSLVYAAAMHLKFFVIDFTKPVINRLEAMTLWIVAICTKTYEDENSVKDADFEYANNLWSKIFTTQTLDPLDKDNELYADNDHKRSQ